jgi:hypothetical protein
MRKADLVRVMVAGSATGWMDGRREMVGKVGRDGTTRVALTIIIYLAQ